MNMRRIALTVIAILATVVCQAQEHLRFMDIPLDGSLEAFCEKLIKEKGFVASEMTWGEGHMSMIEKKLTGDYYGFKNCIFYIGKHERLENVSSIIVRDTLNVLSGDEAKKFISLHDEKFGKHEVDSTQYSTWFTWKTANGEVMVDFRDDGFEVYYTDYSEINIRKVASEEYLEQLERQTVKEICGIPFGSSYEKAKEVLENKYGDPSPFSDKTKIVYLNKSYGGMLFDNIIFLFQSDGYRSFLNGCVFIWDAKNLTDAVEKRDLLYKKLSLKYDLKRGYDDNSLSYYYGGYPPVPGSAYGLTIDIIKYDNRSSNPYSARIMYGSYNYVKEEF